MRMAYTNMMELVSQAESEEVTLAEMLTRSLSSRDLDKVQDALIREMSSNYRNIEEFMSDVSVPSIDEILAMDQEELTELQLVSDHELSDDNLLESD
jgi:hypothetical protein